MTQTDLDRSLEHLLESEGGWSNHPSDRGGATMYGVTQSTYNKWRDRVKRPRQSVRRISHEEARELYETFFWKEAGCDRLPWPVNYLVFDAAVNSGPEKSLKWMQAALGLHQDGKIGPKTVQAALEIVESGNARKLLAIVDQRVQFLSSLVRRSTSQLDFLLGWWRRTQKILAIALTE